jgi:tetratricopeptide (TPR) repeat protein
MAKMCADRQGPLTAALLPGYDGSMLVMPIRKGLALFLCAALAVAAGAAFAPAWSQAAPKASSSRPALPKTPAERDKTLSDLYALLATADDEESAKAVADAIERIWQFSGSPTLDVLMERSAKALVEKKNDLALKLLDFAVELAPDFTEAWNRRAYVHFLKSDYERALGDLRRTLALDPNHFKALEGLAQILREVGQKRGALQAFKKLVDVHPYWANAQQAIDELEREVEGQGI